MVSIPQVILMQELSLQRSDSSLGTTARDEAGLLSKVQSDSTLRTTAQKGSSLLRVQSSKGELSESETFVSQRQADEPIIVDWDDPLDPGNPRNWTKAAKWAAAFTVSAFTFISPISSSMVAPAAGQIAQDFHITNTVEIALTISVFILGYTVGPLFLGPLSEIYGRTIIIHISNIFFIAWNIGCGFAQSKGQLIAFRFLSGIGGSAPLSIGGAVLADLWVPEERGQAIAIYSLAPLLGPAIGPVAGAWIAQLSTWRWVFHSTSITAAVIQVCGFLFLKETYAPLLLDRRAKTLQASMDAEKGNRRPVRTVYEIGQKKTTKEILKQAVFRPFQLFIQEPMIQLLGVYLAFVYGVVYLVLTVMPEIFANVYHEPIGIAGLHYISLAVGLTIASQTNAYYLDKLYVYLKKRNNGVGEPEFRLPCVMPGTILLPIGLLMVGWGAQEHVFWLVPDIGFALIGAGIILVFQGMQTYVIDAFTTYAASALAAVSCFRSLAGFGFPLFAEAMFDALGYGVGCTILAAFAVGVGCPSIWLFWKYGARIRAMSRHAQKETAAT
ncbi:MFS polyamine transporter [Obba rivulosa]|uniref:MFS polyamine transporter n=1 Tax=Obba rivulosa TaxID=1052685 RepID=A0A8E2DS09_9APHY|nr:MFS polyamine transporter [Obba rivulosa]